MNKVSITKWEKMLSENVSEVPVVGLDGVNMRVKHTLSLQEMMQFVEDVVSSCVDPEDGMFRPELRGFAIKYALVSYYTNFNTPSDMSKLYDLLYRTDVPKQILCFIDKEQYKEMLLGIDKRVSHTVRMLQSQAALEASNAVERMSAMVSQVESVFNGVDIDKVNQAMDGVYAIRNMNEENIARAVVDLHRENRSDITNDSGIIVLPKTDG